VILYSGWPQIALGLAAAGAHVALVGDPEVAMPCAAQIERIYGEHRAVAVGNATGRPRDAIRNAVLAYGGFDVAIEELDTSDAPLSAAASNHLARYGMESSVVLIDRKPHSANAHQALESLLAYGSREHLRINAVSAHGVGDGEVADSVSFLATSTWSGVLLRKGE
jgi:hypothetical protein